MSISAFVLSWLNPNTMLFIIGIFTLYMTLTGQRGVRKKGIDQERKIVDWALAICMFITIFVLSYRIIVTI